MLFWPWSRKISPPPHPPDPLVTYCSEPNASSVSLHGSVNDIFYKYIIYKLLAAQATAEKNAAVAQAEKTASKARLADRLISGLGGEFTRWSKNIEEFSVAEGVPIPVVQIPQACGFNTRSAATPSHLTRSNQDIIPEIRMLRASNGVFSSVELTEASLISPIYREILTSL